jgi:hypothetical protein
VKKFFMPGFLFLVQHPKEAVDNLHQKLQSTHFADIALHHG